MKPVPQGGAVIPPEWVGLPADTLPAAGTSLPAAHSTVPAGHGAPARDAIGSVRASPSPAVVELVSPPAPGSERGGCFIEPGKPCSGSGRCRQRGY